jgi:IS30 family transposase
VGTLVEPTSRLVLLLLVWVENGSALEGFSRVLNGLPEPLRKHDQSKEISENQRLKDMTGVTVFFADPHSPWQRAIHENTNGLLRDTCPKALTCHGTPRIT